MQQRAAEDISKRIKDFKILSSITQAVHQSLDFEEIYKITLDMTADLENVDMVTIYLVDEDRKEAVLQAQRNLPEDYLRRASRIPYPKGATWEVIKSGKVLNIEDIQKDPDVGPAGKALGHHGLLGIPIALEEKVIGAIWFSSYKERKFDDGEVELLSSIGNQIAIAIAKANLYRVLHRKNRYEKIISTVTQSVHQSIDLKEVMDNAVEAMSQNIEQANIVGIYLIEDKKAVLKSHIGYKKTYIKKASSIPYPRGFIWETAIDGKPIHCPDTEKDTLIDPAGIAAGIKTYLSMPIRFEGKVFGVIGINSFQKHAFDEEELKLLEIVSHQIETAIGNARHAEALGASEQRYRTLFTQSPVGVCTIDKDLKITHCNESLIEIFQSSRDKIIGLDLNKLKDKSFVPFIKKAFAGHTGSHETNYVATTSGTSLWLAVRTAPLRDSDGKVVSVMGVVEDITERKKSEEALKENLDQLSKKNRFEEIISTVTRTVHKSLDLQEVLENAVESMSENIDVVNHVSIFLVEGTDAVMKVHRGYPDWFIEKIKRIPHPKGFTWDTILEGKTRYCPDIDKDTIIGPAGRQVGSKSYLSIPLKIESNTIGCINVHSLNKDAFEEEDINVLEVVAKQIGIAINKAQQAEALKQSEEALKRSEEHFRLLVETTNVIPWEADAKTFQFTYVGPQAQWLLGYPVEQWYEQDFWPSHLHPDDCEKAIEKCLKSTTKKKDFELEYRMISSDGKIVWFHDLVSVIIEDGEPKMLRGFMIDITKRRKAEQELKNAFSEIEKLKNQLERENIYLQEEVKLQHSHGEIVGESKAMQSVLSLAEQVANTESTVLLLGETGTGKELLANAIHKMSPRKERAIVTVNCAALQPYLIESELFGHERGAFTGAVTKRLGRFEIADGSTIFLDEVGELPLELQSKLLRVLQEGCFERLGSEKTIEVDVRILAASNRDLTKAVEEGTFREDLFYRLNVFPINIPPLREREEDIPHLINTLVKEFGDRMGKNIENIPKKTMQALMSYKWPGNIRELRNVIERAIILAKGSSLHIELPDDILSSESRVDMAMVNIEKEHILRVLEMTHWRIRGKGCAAEILGLKPTTLASKMHKLGIVRQSKH